MKNDGHDVHKYFKHIRRSKLSRLNLGLINDDNKKSETKITTQPLLEASSASSESQLYRLPTPNVNPFRSDQTCKSTALEAAAYSSQLIISSASKNSSQTSKCSPIAPETPHSIQRDKSIPLAPQTPRRTFNPLHVSLQSHHSTNAKVVREVAGISCATLLPRTQMSSSKHVSRYVHDFDQLGLIAKGNFGRVTRCRGRIDGIEYAIKRVPTDKKVNQSNSIAYKEIFALSALETCPNIVRYYQSWLEDGFIYIQLELCETSLSTIIMERHGRHFNESQVIDVLRQVNNGLDHLHSNGLVHLDIKPDNILLRARTYKLGDLGMVTRVNGNNKHDYHEEGDIRFLAREIFQDNRDNLKSADIFSFGASIYSMMICQDLPRTGHEWDSIRDGSLHVRAHRVTIKQCEAVSNSALQSTKRKESIQKDQGDQVIGRVHTSTTSAPNDRISANTKSIVKNVDMINMDSHNSPVLHQKSNFSNDKRKAILNAQPDASWPQFSFALVKLVKKLMQPNPRSRPKTKELASNPLIAFETESTAHCNPVVQKAISSQYEQHKKVTDREFRKRKFSSGLPFPKRPQLRRSETL